LTGDAGPASESRRAGPFGPATRVLFVTGKLAEPALRRVVAGLDLAAGSDVAVMKITVAALMTTSWIARMLDAAPSFDLVLIPGLCEGDTKVLEDKLGVKVQKGPKDLREIPRFFGRAAAAAGPRLLPR